MLEKIINEVHPNRISFLGGLLTTIGVPMLLSPKTDIYGAACVVIGQGIDSIDGYLARKYNATTKEGARLDPLLDKWKNFVIGSYIIAKELYQNNVLLPMTIAANYASDYFSQRARGPILTQVREAYKAVRNPSLCQRDTQKDSKLRANVYGKLKASLQNISSLSYITMELYENHIGKIQNDYKSNIKYALSAMLISSAVLGSVGALKRLNIKPSIFNKPIF